MSQPPVTPAALARLRRLDQLERAVEALLRECRAPRLALDLAGAAFAVARGRLLARALS